MKTEYSVQRSASASLKSALKEADDVKMLVTLLKKGGEPKQYMEPLRYHLSVLNQRVHEYNAYANVLKDDLPTSSTQETPMSSLGNQEE